MKRLVIKQGERIVRKELGASSLTVGRDPACELHFDDPSLSRRHGTFEPTPAGVRFVDLESRNGSWVNFRKVKEADLKPGDTVRVGSLLITYAYDPPPEPPPPPARIPDPADETGTLVASAMPAKPQEADSTVLLSRKEKKPSGDGTVLLRAEPPAIPKKPPDTARLPPEVLRPAVLKSSATTIDGVSAPVAETAEIVEGTSARWSWTAKHGVLTLSVALAVYFVLALPLVRTLGNALREESLRRGRVLLDLLVAENAAAIGEGRTRDLAVETVTREERVKEALLLSLEGKVLAPSSRVDETMTSIPGIEPTIEEIRTFYLGRRGGDYVMVKPILDRGRRVGVALLVYEVSTASGSWAIAILFLGFLTMLLAVAVALALGKRFTLEPSSALRDDIEAVVKGDASRVPLSQGFSELSEIARSVNRLIERAPALAPVAAAPAAASAVRPAAHPPSRERVGGTYAASPAGPPPPEGQEEGACFWADANFVVVRVEPEAASMMGSSTNDMEGRHVIEAVKDQKLLGVVLDCLNALDHGPGDPVSTELSTGTVAVSARRDGDRVVVSLKRTS